jgi:hypothetical protein
MHSQHAAAFTEGDIREGKGATLAQPDACLQEHLDNSVIGDRARISAKIDHKAAL